MRVCVHERGGGARRGSVVAILAILALGIIKQKNTARAQSPGQAPAFAIDPASIDTTLCPLQWPPLASGMHSQVHLQAVNRARGPVIVRGRHA